LFDAAFRIGDYPISPVLFGPAAHHTRAVWIAYEADGLPGYSHSYLDLRAYRNELQIRTQDIGKVSIMFVARVEANLLPQETGRDADLDIGIIRFG
jgi:hypothetical protein